MSLHLAELGVPHWRVFMDTGWEHPSTYDYLRGPLTEKLGPIIEIKGPDTFAELTARKGLFPSRVMRFCTEELKVKPMQAYIRGLGDSEIVNAVGIRRAESAARSKMPEWEWSDGFDCEVWRPLVTWSTEDVLAIHERHGLALNPLYAMGATRVGCWPCIHARKSELAMVARVDPARIKAIADQEAALNAGGMLRDQEMGRPFQQRSMFSYGGGGRGHQALPIYQAVEWANSKRGEWQMPGSGEGCMRHGICETQGSEP